MTLHVLRGGLNGEGVLNHVQSLKWVKFLFSCGVLNHVQSNRCDVLEAFELRAVVVSFSKHVWDNGPNLASRLNAHMLV